MDTTDRQPVLVTGASGFIGRRLVRRLMERQFRVTCLVRAGSRVDELQAAGASLVTGDVTDRRSVEQALAQSQAAAVFHLAGLVKTSRRNAFTEVNAGGVATVAAACAAGSGAAHPRNPPVLLVVSSLAAAGPCSADHVRVERDIPAPVSNYGRSKLAGEQAAARYAAVVPITIVRPPIVFGAGDSGVLEIFAPIARWGIHLVPGMADRRLSLIYVDDLVEGLLLAVEKGERLGEQGPQALAGQGVYFMAVEDTPTYAQLGQAMAQALGQKPPAILHLPGPLLRLIGTACDLAARTRRGSASGGYICSDKITEALAGSWTCSATKARTQLGWSPAATLTQRLQETADWYRQAQWI